MRDMLDQAMNRMALCASAAALIALAGAAGVSGAERPGGPGMPNREARKISAPEERAVRDRWEIRVPAGTLREYIYTNKVAAHFSGETVGPNSKSYHGLFVSMHEYVEGWDFSLGRTPLRLDEIGEAFAYPHVLYRSYPKRGVMEEIFLPDTLNALAVTLSGELGTAGEIVPWIDMRHIWQTPTPEYRVFWSKDRNTLLISRADEPFADGRPAWIALTANVPMEFTPDEQFRPTEYPKDAARRAMARTNPFTPGCLSFTRSAQASAPAVFVFGLGADEHSAAEEARKLLDDLSGYKKQKLDLVEERLSIAEIVTGDENVNKAFRWARVSMDNLIMNQRGRGIYAGFYWFPNYWGRDSFISLPGACLATGRYDTAREILTSFMTYQDVDTASQRLGRFPNIVNPDNLQYAGVDGTWWLVRAAWKYWLATGDAEFLEKGFPVVRLAIEGAFVRAVDERGFLTHGDAETWMDAGGEAHPYTPRGDRAVEVQALFHHGLLAGSAWARTLAAAPNAGAQSKELESLAKRWESAALRLRGAFRETFWNDKDGYLYDHLNTDGTRDSQLRANAILALWVSRDRRDFDHVAAGDAALRSLYAEPLIDGGRARAIMRTASEHLILPHGVTSLSPNDPQFRPRHLDLNRYFFDEAYHNGDVWEWLTGPAASCLVEVGEKEKAWKLVEPLVREILDEACVGTLREIRDGVDAPGKTEFGGATSQAWSLAEFIRVCLSEFVSFEPREKAGAPECRYMGIRGWTAADAVPDASLIPAQWKETRFRLPFVCTGSGGPARTVREGHLRSTQRSD